MRVVLLRRQRSSTNRFHDPCHPDRVGLHRTHAGAAAVPIDRHRVQFSAAANHTPPLPSRSLHTDRGADTRGRPAVNGKSRAHPVQSCVLARHLRHHRAGASGVRRQKRSCGMAGVRLACAIAADDLHQPAGPASDRRRDPGNRGSAARRRRPRPSPGWWSSTW